MKRQAASPDQAMYDAVVLAARKNLFGDQDDTRFKMVVQRLNGGKDNLAETVGHVAGVTLANIQNAAAKQNRAIPQATIVEAADEVVDNVLDIAEAAKLLGQDREAVKKKALFAALRVVGQQQVGSMTPEKKAEAQAELAKTQGVSSAPGKQRGQGIIASRMKESA